MRLALLALAVVALGFGQKFEPLFDGRTLNGWFVVNKQGPGFIVEDGKIVCPVDGGQKLMSDREYANFVFRFEFKLQVDGNNGVGIRAPRNGHTSTIKPVLCTDL